MYYEINVSRYGKHYFATHKRSLTSREHAAKMALHFEKVFPASEGYAVALTFWHAYGTSIDPREPYI